MVDSNVVLDVIVADPIWADWSRLKLSEFSQTSALLIDPVAYAEISVRMGSVADVDHVLSRLGATLAGPGREALFAAGKAYAAYRDRKGVKTGVLPDFLIGANAQERGAALLTRDAGRYRSYFPRLALIAPDTHP